MDFNDNFKHPGDIINNTRNVLAFVINSLSWVPAGTSIELNVDATCGLAVILMACEQSLAEAEALYSS